MLMLYKIGRFVERNDTSRCIFPLACILGMSILAQLNAFQKELARYFLLDELKYNFHLRSYFSFSNFSDGKYC